MNYKSISIGDYLEEHGYATIQVYDSTDLKLIESGPDLLSFVKKQHDLMNCICSLIALTAGTRLDCTHMECTKCVAAALIARAEGSI